MKIPFNLDDIASEELQGFILGFRQSDKEDHIDVEEILGFFKELSRQKL